jgi:hypothetical protein
VSTTPNWPPFSSIRRTLGTRIRSFTRGSFGLCGLCEELELERGGKGLGGPAGLGGPEGAGGLLGVNAIQYYFRSFLVLGYRKLEGVSNDSFPRVYNTLETISVFWCPSLGAFDACSKSHTRGQ